jgi:hypothetical protein
MKAKMLLLGILLCAGATNAQLSISAGGEFQFLTAKRDNFPAPAAVADLITLGGGNPDGVIAKWLRSSVAAPKIGINYKIPFKKDFFVILSAGTSQDWENSFKLAGTVAVQGKTRPYPKAFRLGITAYKKQENGIIFGGTFRYDNQTSEPLVNGSNLSPTVRGLLNQISPDIRFINNPIQFHGLFGWEASKDRFDFRAYSQLGYTGGVLGVNLGVEIHYYFKKQILPNTSFENFE